MGWGPRCRAPSPCLSFPFGLEGAGSSQGPRSWLLAASQLAAGGFSHLIPPQGSFSYKSGRAGGVSLQLLARSERSGLGTALLLVLGGFGGLQQHPPSPILS